MTRRAHRGLLKKWQALLQEEWLGIDQTFILHFTFLHILLVNHRTQCLWQLCYLWGIKEIGLMVEGDRQRAGKRCEQVLDAAAACFRRRGFHGASMAEISREAGMSVGHI